MFCTIYRDCTDAIQPHTGLNLFFNNNRSTILLEENSTIIMWYCLYGRQYKIEDKRRKFSHISFCLHINIVYVVCNVSYFFVVFAHCIDNYYCHG